mmetsp:Transcript_21871/g.67362  ORF Transcript_21871/g.67362 Transcript_21871/m.67362 type:complete len:330 (+) Transcript_21871:1583-2572(+)
MKALELPTRGYADEEARAWQPVAVDEHGDEHKSAPPEPAEPRTCLSRVVAAPLVPDAPTLFGRTLPAPHVRLAKFFALSYVLLLATHAWIRAHGNARKWERDADYSLADFHLLDLDACAGDVLWFFVVGRWWRRPGVDSINFLAPAALGIYVFSKSGSVKMTHHSISLYAIHCEWPAAVTLAATLLLLLVVALVVAHVVRAWRDRLLAGRLVEIAATVAVFWLPRFRDPNFHLHHWFWTWFVGMHANQDAWWSVASSAFLWGGYVNGVGAWGRDDVLGCRRSFAAAIDQGCGFMECYADQHGAGPNATLPKPPRFADAPSWRHCTGDAP